LTWDAGQLHPLLYRYGASLVWRHMHVGAGETVPDLSALNAANTRFDGVSSLSGSRLEAKSRHILIP